MSVFTFKNNDVKQSKIILHGSNCDICHVTYIKISPDHFVETEYFLELEEDEDFEEKHIRTKVLSRKNMDDLFNLQYGSPMMYIDKEMYDDFINQKHF